MLLRLKAACIGTCNFSNSAPCHSQPRGSTQLVCGQATYRRVIIMPRKNLTRASVKLLPSETLCSIFRFALEDIIEDDMKTTAEAEHRIIAGGLPFPHTMASVCRQWRDVISSAPELWTRIFCVMPNKSRHQTLTDLTSQLQKAHDYPVHLTIVNKHNYLKQKEVPRILNFIALHIGQLKSLRIRNFYGLYGRRPHQTILRHISRTCTPTRVFTSDGPENLGVLDNSPAPTTTFQTRLSHPQNPSYRS